MEIIKKLYRFPLEWEERCCVSCGKSMMVQIEKGSCVRVACGGCY